MSESASRISGIEIFARGVHRSKPYSAADMADIVRNFQEFSAPDAPRILLRVPLVIGHEEDQQYLQRTDIPAAGWATDVWTQGGRLFADADHVPAEVSRLIKGKAYRVVSAEIYDEPPDGVPGRGKMLRRIALLGADIPEVKGLAEIPTPEPYSEGAFASRRRAALVFRRRVKMPDGVWACFSEVRRVAKGVRKLAEEEPDEFAPGERIRASSNMQHKGKPPADERSRVSIDDRRPIAARGRGLRYTVADDQSDTEEGRTRVSSSGRVVNLRDSMLAHDDDYPDDYAEEEPDDHTEAGDTYDNVGLSDDKRVASRGLRVQIHANQEGVPPGHVRTHTSRGVLVMPRRNLQRSDAQYHAEADYGAEDDYGDLPDDPPRRSDKERQDRDKEDWSTWQPGDEYAEDEGRPYRRRSDAIDDYETEASERQNRIIPQRQTAEEAEKRAADMEANSRHFRHKRPPRFAEDDDPEIDIEDDRPEPPARQPRSLNVGDRVISEDGKQRQVRSRRYYRSDQSGRYATVQDEDGRTHGATRLRHESDGAPGYAEDEADEELADGESTPLQTGDRVVWGSPISRNKQNSRRGEITGNSPHYGPNYRTVRRSHDGAPVDYVISDSDLHRDHAEGDEETIEPGDRVVMGQEGKSHQGRNAWRKGTVEESLPRRGKNAAIIRRDEDGEEEVQPGENFRRETQSRDHAEGDDIRPGDRVVAGDKGKTLASHTRERRDEGSPVYTSGHVLERHPSTRRGRVDVEPDDSSFDTLEDLPPEDVHTDDRHHRDHAEDDPDIEDDMTDTLDPAADAGTPESEAADMRADMVERLCDLGFDESLITDETPVPMLAELVRMLESRQAAEEETPGEPVAEEEAPEGEESVAVGEEEAAANGLPWADESRPREEEFAEEEEENKDDDVERDQRPWRPAEKEIRPWVRQDMERSADKKMTSRGYRDYAEEEDDRQREDDREQEWERDNSPVLSQKEREDYRKTEGDDHEDEEDFDLFGDEYAEEDDDPEAQRRADEEGWRQQGVEDRRRAPRRDVGEGGNRKEEQINRQERVRHHQVTGGVGGDQLRAALREQEDTRDVGHRRDVNHPRQHAEDDRRPNFRFGVNRPPREEEDAPPPGEEKRDERRTHGHRNWLDVAGRDEEAERHAEEENARDNSRANARARAQDRAIDRRISGADRNQRRRPPTQPQPQPQPKGPTPMKMSELAVLIRQEVAAAVRAETGRATKQLQKHSEGAIAEVHRATAQVSAAEKKRGVEAVVERLSAEGRLAPVEAESIRKRLLRADSRTPVAKFSEGNKTIVATEYDLQVRELERRPTLFAERFAQPGKGGTAESEDAEVAKVEAHFEMFSERFGKINTTREELVGAFKIKRKQDREMTAEKFLGGK